MHREVSLVITDPEKPQQIVELRLVGGWWVELERGLRMALARAKEAPRLPPIPEDDPE